MRAAAAVQGKGRVQYIRIAGEVANAANTGSSVLQVNI